MLQTCTDEELANCSAFLTFGSILDSHTIALLFIILLENYQSDEFGIITALILLNK